MNKRMVEESKGERVVGKKNRRRRKRRRKRYIERVESNYSWRGAGLAGIGAGLGFP